MPLHSDIKVEKQKSFFKLFFDMLRIVSKFVKKTRNGDFKKNLARTLGAAQAVRRRRMERQRNPVWPARQRMRSNKISSSLKIVLLYS